MTDLAIRGPRELPRALNHHPMLLVAARDRTLADRLIGALRHHDYLVDDACDGHVALHRALTRSYEALVIERRIPVVDGFDLLVRLRKRGIGTPAVLLVDASTTADRIAILDAGADDCAPVTIETDELLARLRAVMRRANTDGHRLAIGRGSVDLISRLARRSDSSTVRLSGRETALLQELAIRPGRIVSRYEILRRVFDTAEDPSIVETYVYYLRRKLGPDAVRTVRGRGYQIGDI
jgi:two-component system response regulator QseB